MALDTVMSVYARRLIDHNIDTYSLSAGDDQSDAQWPRIKESYTSQYSAPAKPIVDYDRDPVPLQLNLSTWRSADWSAFHSDSNKAAAAIMEAASTDRSIMPVRYRQARKALVLYIQSYPQAAAVRQYTQLLVRRRSVWAACCKVTRQQCEASFVHYNSVCTAPLYHGSCSALYRYVQPVHFGFVTVTGAGVDTEQVVLGDWARAGVFLWTFRCVGK